MFSRALHFLFTTFGLVVLASTFPLSSNARVLPRGQQQPQTPSTSDTVSIQPSAGDSAVIVSVAKSRVRIGELVTFTLTPAKIVNDPRFKVTVDFGDGTRLNTRQVVVTHRYQATGHYTVRASVLSPANQTDPDKPDPTRPIPRVTLDVSPTPTDANKPVRFDAQLSANYPGIKYRFAFGDGSQSDWIESSRTSHSYATAGTFLAYVDLGLNYAGRIRQVGGSLRQSIVVNQPLPVDPKVIDPKVIDPTVVDDRLPGPVRLSAGPTPVQQGKPVSFGARAEATNANVRYRFVFGDGSFRDWQTSDKVTHEYSSKGNYTARVTLGLVRNGRIQALSSDTQRIQVTSTAPVTAVDLQVNPVSVSVGQGVGFIAQVTPAESDLRYRFVFGEGSSQTEWLTDSGASYSYKTAGDYTAHVEVGRWTNGLVVPLATSNNKVVKVAGGAISSVSPSPGPSGGGGSPGDAGTTGSPSVPGNGGPGDGLPDKWWLYLLLALLLAFVAYKTYQALFAPRTTFHASRDPGDAEVDTATKGLEISSQVLLKPNVSDARYLVHSDDAIVRSVRRENV